MMFTKNQVFHPLSTCTGPSPLLVDVHMRSTQSTHRSLETASTMTFRAVHKVHHARGGGLTFDYMIVIYLKLLLVSYIY